MAQVGRRQLEEVPLAQQHGRAAVVQVQKGAQVGEPVGGAGFVGVGVGHVHAVAGAEGEHQLGLEGALDVQVQLGFGDAAHEGFVAQGDSPPGGFFVDAAHWLRPRPATAHSSMSRPSRITWKRS